MGYRDSIINELRKVHNIAYEELQNKRSQRKKSNREFNRINDKLGHFIRKRNSLHEKINRLYEHYKASKSCIDAEWDNYKKDLKIINEKIDTAKEKLNEYQTSMNNLFDKASDEYNFGDKAMASYYSGQGKALQYDRDFWKNEFHRLIEEKRHLTKPSADSTDFPSELERLNEEMKNTKASIFNLRPKFDEAKKIKEEAKEEFYKAQAEFNKARENLIKFKEETKMQPEEKLRKIAYEYLKKNRTILSNRNNTAGYF